MNAGAPTVYRLVMARVACGYWTSKYRYPIRLVPL